MSMLAKTKAWLKKRYPLPFRVTIRVVSDASLPGAYGVWQWDGRRGFIQLRRSLSDEHAAETLLEEYAHAIRHTLAVPVDYDDEAHDGHFWLVYGAIVTEWRKTNL